MQRSFKNLEVLGGVVLKFENERFQVMSKFRLRSFNFLISSLGIVTQALQKDLIRFGCSLCVCGVFSCGLAAKAANDQDLHALAT